MREAQMRSCGSALLSDLPNATQHTRGSGPGNEDRPDPSLYTPSPPLLETLDLTHEA